MARIGSKRGFAFRALSSTVALQMMLSTCSVSVAFAADEAMMRNNGVPLPRISESEVKDLLNPTATPSAVTSEQPELKDAQTVETPATTDNSDSEKTPTKTSRFSKLKKLVRVPGKSTKEDKTQDNSKTASTADKSKTATTKTTTEKTSNNDSEATLTADQTAETTTTTKATSPATEARGWDAPTTTTEPAKTTTKDSAVLQSTPDIVKKFLSPQVKASADTASPTTAEPTTATAETTKPTVTTEAKTGTKVESKAEAKVEAKTETKAESQTESKPSTTAAATTSETKAADAQTTSAAATTETKAADQVEVVNNDEAAPATKDGAIVSLPLLEKSKLSPTPAVALALPDVKLDTGNEAKSEEDSLVVDNDEAVETEETIAYEDLPTDEGKTKVKTGARFPVVVSSDLSSKSAKKGDPIEARLKYDLKIGDRLIAKKGAVVNGHIDYVLKARSAMHSLISPERWYRNSGVLGVTFDEIINDKGEHLPLVAAPARQALIVKNKGEGRVLGVNHKGQVTGPWSQQLKYKAVRIGLNAALAPAGVFSFGAMPVALGVIGAVNPSFAFMKPVGQNVRHRRIKGFVWGALSGVPGSWIIEDTVVRGQESVIKPGDEFLCEFRQEFTGEPASEAQMMPGSSAKVHGQVVPGKEKKKK